MRPHGRALGAGHVGRGPRFFLQSPNDPADANKRMVAVSNVDAQVETLRQRLAPAVAALDLELYDVELTGAGKQRTLRVTVERRRPRRDHRGHAGRVADPRRRPGAHRLVPPRSEQPGCRARAPHARALRRCASARPFPSRSAPSPARAACTARSSTPTTSAARSRSTGEREELAYADITQARTVFEWGPQPRPGQSSKRRPGPPRAKG